MTPADDGIAPARVPAAARPERENDDKSLWRRGFPAPLHASAAAGDLVLCKPERLCYTLPAREHLFRLFLGSSAVEHSTVNRMVAGSNPARGASHGFYILRQRQIILDQRGIIVPAAPKRLARSLLDALECRLPIFLDAARGPASDRRPAAAGCPQIRNSSHLAHETVAPRDQKLSLQANVIRHTTRGLRFNSGNLNMFLDWVYYT